MPSSTVVKDMRKSITSFPPVVWMLFSIIVVFAFTGENFFTYGNFLNILKQASPFLILAIGETMAILVGGIDLSIGYVMSFSSVMVALTIKVGIPFPIAILVGILIGGLCGLVNGISVAKFKIPYFIATYGMGSVVLGLGSLLTDGVSVPALDRNFRFISDGYLFGTIPMVVFLAVLVFFTMKIIIRKTSYGRNLYGLGGNRESLFLSGVNIVKAEVLVFTVVGLLAGLAGVIFAARSASGHPSYGAGWEFDSVAATIIGGNSFSEGKGNINKTVLGVFFIQIFKTGLNISGVAPQAQSLLVGLVVVIAISTDVLIQNRK